MRFSYFMASIMLPHCAVWNVGGAGTRGTQALPPGTGAATSFEVIAGRLFAVRYVLMSARASAPWFFRMWPSAASMSFSALRSTRLVPVPEFVRMVKKR